jgi:hypothetical protein
MNPDVMRKAIKAMLKKNERKQHGRHHWEWFVRWLDGQEVRFIDPVVKEVMEETSDAKS